MEEPIFFCNCDPRHIFATFIGPLEGLDLQSKTQMKFLFLDIETPITIKLRSLLENLTQRHNRREKVSLDDCDNKRCASTQFLHIQKNHLIDLQQQLERYCNVLPVFCFNSAKYDLNLFKYYLLPIPVNERDIEPTVVNKAIHFFLFKFGDIQLSV